jgi:hypothetical protein
MATMKRVYEDALAAHNKTEQESLLPSFGLHLTEVLPVALHLSFSNLFWLLSNLDPYRGYT